MAELEDIGDGLVLLAAAFSNSRRRRAPRNNSVSRPSTDARARSSVKFHKDARIDPNRLMNLVTNTEGAQFTPAGVLRVPLDGATSAGRVLDLLESRFAQLKT